MQDREKCRKYNISISFPTLHILSYVLTLYGRGCERRTSQQIALLFVSYDVKQITIGIVLLSQGLMSGNVHVSPTSHSGCVA